MGLRLGVCILWVSASVELCVFHDSTTLKSFVVPPILCILPSLSPFHQLLEILHIVSSSEVPRKP